MNLKKDIAKIKQREALAKMEGLLSKSEEKSEVWRTSYLNEKKSIKSLKKENIELQKDMDNLLFLKQKTKKMVIKPSKGKGDSESVAVVLCSDWHVGEYVSKESSGYKNFFNLDVADRRIKLLWQKTVLLTNIERKGTHIDTLVMWLGGDMVNGVLREEDLETNELGPTDSALWLLPRIKAGIDYFLKHFDHIKIPCSTGNHGRLTPKLRIGTEHRNSIESMLYGLIDLHYKDDPRVEVFHPRSTFTWVEVFNNFKLRASHGTFVKGGGGIGGIYPSLFKYLFRQNQTRKADFDIMGHHHVFTPGGTFLIIAISFLRFI